MYQKIKYVVNNSNYVKINENKIDEFIANIEILNYKHWYSVLLYHHTITIFYY